MSRRKGKKYSAEELSLQRWDKEVKRKKKLRDTRHMVRILIATMIAGCFAVLFLMPIVLTITNSFMSASEISANYGQVFATTDTGLYYFDADALSGNIGA